MISRELICAAICAAYATGALAQEQTFKVSNTTPNCRDSSTVTHRVCLPDGKKIRTWSIKTISAAGTRHDIVSQEIAPGAPNCLQIVTAVSPNGEDCISIPFASPICNCKGRGWIELDVRVIPDS
jgi:hypothetical protein